MVQRAQFLLGNVDWEAVEAAIPEARTRSGAGLLQDILRIPDAENEAFSATIFPGLVFSDLNAVNQAVALELLSAGWLEARHDGGFLEARILDASARLVPGWRFELLVVPGGGTGISGMHVFEPETGFDDLVLTEQERLTLGIFGGDPGSRNSSLLVLIGEAGAGKTARAHALARDLKSPILVPSMASPMDPRRTVSRNLAIMEAISLELGAPVLLECSERFFPRSVPAPSYCEPWIHFLEHTGALCILTTCSPDQLDPAIGQRADWVHAIGIPKISERRALWELQLKGLPVSAEIDYELLAARYRLSAGAIVRAVGLARSRAAKRGEVFSFEDLEFGAGLQIRHGLDKMAQKVETRLTLADLIVNDEVRVQVQAIVDAARVRERVFDDWGFGKKQDRGRGLSMLFDGEPGTGKTLCAEILSAELKQPLYRVSMANIVSKWVGETEKNLEHIFTEAAGTGAILLFDEADALFSQRVEVQHANDRFANLEVNALLQLMESHDGVCILTTNLKSGIDKAFERRLSFRVHFPFPDAGIRAKLWEHHLPKTAPVGSSVDVDRLSEAFELSGGSIRNAVVRAAYRAAARGSSIEQSDLAEGARAECVAAGKLYRALQDDD